MRNLWVGLFLLVPIFGVLVFIIAAARGAWLPHNVGNIGAGIDHLFYVILWITGFFFVATEALLVYAMFASRGGNSGKGTYLHGNNLLEIGWTIMTAAILIFVAFYQVPVWVQDKITPPWQAEAKTSAVQQRKDADALVTGSQFLWQIRYPLAGKKLDPKNPNLGESFELVNELHTPAGEDVLLYVTSRDVIHSFWLPNVRVKQDTLPNTLIPVWFKVDPEKLAADKDNYDAKHKRREYQWYCAELCGWGHFRMRAKLYIYDSKADYEKWLARKSEQFKTGKALQGPGTDE